MDRKIKPLHSSTAVLGHRRRRQLLAPKRGKGQSDSRVLQPEVGVCLGTPKDGEVGAGVIANRKLAHGCLGSEKPKIRAFLSTVGYFDSCRNLSLVSASWLHSAKHRTRCHIRAGEFRGILLF